MSQNLVATPKNKQKRNSEIEMGVQCCLYWTYFASRSFFLWAFCKHYSLPGHFAVQRILVGKLVGIQEDLGKFTINRWFSHSWCLPADFQKKNTEASAIAMIPARRMIDLPCSLAEWVPGWLWFFLHVYFDEKREVGVATQGEGLHCTNQGRHTKKVMTVKHSILTDSCRFGI